MAKLTNFIGPNTKAGQSEEIDAVILFHIKVGTGKVTECSDYALGFNGEVSSTFWSGNFNIKFELTDQNPSSNNGPCTVTFNGQATTGSYQVDGNTLVITANLSNGQEVVKLSRSDNYTEINLSGAVTPPNIILEPVTA